MKSVSNGLGHSTTVFTSDLYTDVVPRVATDPSQRVWRMASERGGTRYRAERCQDRENLLWRLVGLRYEP